MIYNKFGLMEARNVAISIWDLNGTQCSMLCGVDHSLKS